MKSALQPISKSFLPSLPNGVRHVVGQTTTVARVCLGLLDGETNVTTLDRGTWSSFDNNYYVKPNVILTIQGKFTVSQVVDPATLCASAQLYVMS